MLPVIDLKGKAIVLLSGGLDSAVLAAWAKTQYSGVEALVCDYGAKHGHAEQVASEYVCRALGIPRVKVTIPPIFGGSRLTDGTGTNVVPARNTMLLAHGIVRAAATSAALVLMGSNADDHADFPDCRPAFFTFAARMAEMGTGNTVTVRAPFCMKQKSEVIRLGLDLGVPLGLTHTCYLGARPACGECQACKTRLAAFAEIGETDPIAYAQIQVAIPTAHRSVNDTLRLAFDLSDQAEAALKRLDEAGA